MGTLRKTLRSHRQTLLTDDLSDNIASHSFRVTMIGLFLAKLEKTDPYKVIVMCLLHDLEETRAGDQNWIHKKFVKVFEEEIREGQLKQLSKSDDLLQLSSEYQERKTKEAKIAKDADLLDQILLLKEYAWQGNKEAEDWLKGREQEKLMSTLSAKKLALEIYKQKPSEWWGNLWTSKRRSN
ncbi:phosphohydrolase [Candidatus Shapirobacteria bacterium CG_4_9_14_0_2_um_filter_40_11]|uniref:5'-deoxynucleotidase n=1 Tax=Candidatus Shapirobacteria bacterium CG_4_9_14_0_2_um_filter_40_11 TaxID=1974876 RepID=A0A2M8EV74_9BACT|nr:MAG: phosphohydrolase [Candidatus Shapirobacteria bacterium CG_4_9_14_0_2_um_filter_40_11]